MSKSSTAKVGSQGTMLPLEEWIAGEAARRAPDREPRQIGSIVADIVDGLGRPNAVGSGGGKAPHPIGPKRDGEGPTRIETGKNAEPEGPASFARGAKASQATGSDFLPRTILDRLVPTNGAVAVVIVCTGMSSETEHQETTSGSETWIDF